MAGADSIQSVPAVYDHCSVPLSASKAYKCEFAVMPLELPMYTLPLATTAEVGVPWSGSQECHTIAPVFAFKQNSDSLPVPLPMYTYPPAIAGESSTAPLRLRLHNKEPFVAFMQYT